MKQVSTTVLWSVVTIFAIMFFIYLLFWEKIKEYFITEFWQTMTNKGYLTQLMTELMRDPNSFFGKKQ